MALGIQLLFNHLPKRFKGSNIDYASRVMGVAIMIIPITTFIYCLSGVREYGPQYATAANLSAYCLTSTLMATSYYILLDQISDRPLIKIHMSLGGVFPALLWLALLYGGEKFDRHAIIAAYTIFCVLTIIHISSCIYFYRMRLKEWSENIEGEKPLELKLIGRIIHISIALMIIGVISPSSSSYPLWLVMIFVIFFVVGTIYIYACYKRISWININTITTLVDQSPIEKVDDRGEEDSDSSNDLALNKNVIRNIERHLQRWLSRKEYLNADLSITDLVKATYTNRTYLSRYINSVYGCSFKAWITALRIEEAKELMIKQSELSISSVAARTGFASVESFSHTFTRCCHMPPSRWREENCPEV